MSAGPWLLADEWSVTIYDPLRLTDLPAGTVVLEVSGEHVGNYDGFTCTARALALIDGDEVRVNCCHGGGPPPMTPCCRVCLDTNSEYVATNYEAMDGTPCCENCERYVTPDQKHRRQLAHEEAADMLNAQRKDER